MGSQELRSVGGEIADGGRDDRAGRETSHKQELWRAWVTLGYSCCGLWLLGAWDVCADWWAECE